MSYTIFKTEKTKPIQGVLFDLDGVILDTEKLYSRFWRKACGFYGFNMSFEQSLQMRSLNHKAAQEILVRFFGPEASYPLIHAKRIELMAAFVAENGVEAKANVYELLDYLDANGIPYAITTASPIDRVTGNLEHVHLLHRFRKICTVAEVAQGKPAPDIYLFGAQSLGLAPEDCLAVEDSYTGILSAAAAGCMATVVPDLDEPGDNILSAAYAKIDTLRDAIDLIEASHGAV